MIDVFGICPLTKLSIYAICSLQYVFASLICGVAVSFVPRYLTILIVNRYYRQ